VKQVLADLLEGSLLTPTLATVLGCIFGLVVFVVLNSQGTALDPKVHWGIAIGVALVAAGGINLFLKPPAPSAHPHD
jgi:hypothetical protein